MISSMARADIKRLRDKGATVTDDDVIVINDLAKALSKQAIMAEYASAPRAVPVGGSILHEPTLAADEWCQVYAVNFFPKRLSLADRLGGWLFRRGLEPMAYARCYSLAHARLPGTFDTLTSEEKAVRAVVEWTSRLTCTDAELMQACLYATYGEALQSVAHPDLAKLRTKKTQDERANWQIAVEDGVKAGLGLSLADLKTLSFDEIAGMIHRRSEFILGQTHGAKAVADRREAIAQDVKRIRFDEYIRLLEAIEKRNLTQ